MLVQTVKKWIWLDGDIGRRVQVQLNGTNYIAEVSPQYEGRGEYSYDWYLELWPMDYVDPNSEMDFDMLLTQPIKIPTRYRTDANGNEAPVARELDAYANAYLSQLKLCATCNLFFLPGSLTESLQVSNEIAFCSRNHHDMWESANA